MDVPSLPTWLCQLQRISLQLKWTIKVIGKELLTNIISFYAWHLFLLNAQHRVWVDNKVPKLPLLHRHHFLCSQVVIPTHIPKQKKKRRHLWLLEPLHVSIKPNSLISVDFITNLQIGQGRLLCITCNISNMELLSVKFKL